MADPLAQPITRLKGVGERLAGVLAKLHIASLQDLLFHLPFRYVDRTRVTPLGELIPQQSSVVEGTIVRADVAYGRRRSLVCVIEDNSGQLALRFYHFSAAQKAKLEPGAKLRCFGEARRGAAGLEMYHPEYEFMDGDYVPLEQTLTPIYHATEGISQLRLRKLISQALAQIKDSEVKELLPNRTDKIHLLEALQFLHNPPIDVELDTLSAGQHPYQQRLALEELVAHHWSLLRARQNNQKLRAPVLLPHEKQQQQLLLQMGFQLTNAQARVVQDIATDLQKPHCMLRLVQGDVGSGKTAVAALAAIQAIANGFQVALMAPTELLAEQHLQQFQRWFEPLAIQVNLLTGKQSNKIRQHNLAAIANGEAQCIIGTHALIQSEVEYHQLGLVIIDEQHRFGVQQRLALRNKSNEQPHQLIMTATPIPRTLAMSVYADLDCSNIDELPPGRIPIQTSLIGPSKKLNIVERLGAACSQGQQAYWVCTIIEESETLEVQAAENATEFLQQQLPHLKIGLIHGKLKGDEKEAVMAQFKSGELQLLVATTVIEVGVDVPNASIMVIENPERLGLAQLHQLRGRVGRGSQASYCILLYGEKLSLNAKQRLQVMRETNDGFVIAEKDLEIRGPGEVLGTRQTGLMQLKVADLERDGHLLPTVKAIAAELSDQPNLVDALILRWLGRKPEYLQA